MGRGKGSVARSQGEICGLTSCSNQHFSQKSPAAKLPKAARDSSPILKQFGISETVASLAFGS